MDPVPSLRTARSTVPGAVEQALARALAKSPADRYATALQFAEALGGSALAGAAPGAGGSRRLLAGLGVRPPLAPARGGLSVATPWRHARPAALIAAAYGATVAV